MKTRTLQIELEVIFRRKKSHPYHPSSPFKEKEKEKNRLLGGQWKEKEKVPLLGGQWKEKEKVPLFGGQWKEKEKVPFYLFPLPLKQTYLNLHFLSFDIKVLPYHGPKPFFTSSLPFLGI